MRNFMLAVKHEGRDYQVDVTFETHLVDDSYEGHMAGYQFTYHASHREVDLDTLEVKSVWRYDESMGEDGEYIDLDDVPGLMEAIEERAAGLDL